MKNNNLDTCTSFHIYNGAFRGRLVRLNNVLNDILSRHTYPLPIAAVVAEGSALACILSGSIKYDGLFTLQTQSSGPLSQLVVDVTTDGKIRACATFDEARLAKAQSLRKVSGQIEPAPDLMGEGHLAFTVDQGRDTELYQGIVELKGKTFADFALKYFTQSEQIDTFIKLYLQAPNEVSKGWQAFGLMIQKMPEIKDAEENDNWEEAKIFAQSLQENEVFDTKLSSEQILNRLYHSSSLVIGDEKHYYFGCRCSRDKLQTTLSGFSKEDIDSMVENNKISAKCNFCSETYQFDKGELIKQ